jgi:hypothetical protein
MHHTANQLLRLGCAFGFHHYGPWEDPSTNTALARRDCVRCGTRQHRDSDNNTVESRWVKGREDAITADKPPQ